MSVNQVSDMMVLYSVSPVHAGSGQALSAIDLPIQRERHTQWPIVQASGVKGALREHFRRTSEDKALINFIFGLDDVNDKGEEKQVKDSEGNKIESVPGCLAVSDAKIFAFPMRSDVAPFVHVTCPAVLKRLKRDLEFVGKQMELPAEVTDLNARVLKGDLKTDEQNKLILEDVEVGLSDGKIELPSQLADEIQKLVMVSDEVFQYCVTSCTDIQTQIKIKSKSGTADDGALRYEELLPADTVLYSVLYFQSSAFDSELKAQMIAEKVQNSISDFVQIGGDWTLGRGICKVAWMQGGQNE